MVTNVDSRARLTRVYPISALHVLQQPGLSLEENLELFGACARPHGHNYQVQVTVAGPIDTQTGEVADREVLDATVRTVLIEPYDGSHLNEHFASTTGEALARDFFELLQPRLPDLDLVRVTLVETAKNRFAYPA